MSTRISAVFSRKITSVGQPSCLISSFTRRRAVHHRSTTIPAAAHQLHADRFAHYPKNVGVLAMDTYFPKTYVAQEDLEGFDGVSAGKYKIGLGQTNMAFVNDREDIYSVCLTVVSNLLEKYGLSPRDIGRLEVGTETIIDHSKSVKSVLMQLFADSGNTDVEGVDTINACYGGTSALFNSLAWVESSAWNGKYALVVSADIAEYAKGPARPTGGAGAVAMLVGPNAPLVVERGVRASHMEHAYDFYKPNLDSPYPVVDGKFSNVCYLRSLDTCYQSFTKKFQALFHKELDLKATDFALFHAPYNKLVQKSFARLYYNDCLRFPDLPEHTEFSSLLQVPLEKSYEHKELESTMVKASHSEYKRKVEPSTLLPREIGNTYTASLYMGLASLVFNQGDHLADKRMLMFSYGSGLAASMFSLHGQSDTGSKHALKSMQSILDLKHRLAARTKVSPQEFDKTMDVREKLHKTGEFQPTDPLEALFPGTFSLAGKDSLGRRTYQKIPTAAEQRIVHPTYLNLHAHASS